MLTAFRGYDFRLDSGIDNRDKLSLCHQTLITHKSKTDQMPRAMKITYDATVHLNCSQSWEEG